MAKGQKLRLTSTDFWYSCPCGYRYDKCGTKSQLNLIAKLHFKACDQGHKLSPIEIHGDHNISAGTSQTEYVDAAIYKATSA